ncbi:hypothetical protein COBT_001633 [Conglomerata obtusa]
MDKSTSTELLSPITTNDGVEKSVLQNIRVIQKNLVYVIGIPQKYADEVLLMKNEFFGQFGKIRKFVLNKRTSNLEATASAYITYAAETEATKCISEIDESCLEGKMIKATFGTTKYCSFYLKNVNCQNLECMYLHEKGKDCDSLTKDEMNTSKHKLHNFECVNKNKERIGRKSNFEDVLNVFFRYKSQKTYDEPDKIDFTPIDM